jgi:hypothetical protein
MMIQRSPSLRGGGRAVRERWERSSENGSERGGERGSER